MKYLIDTDWIIHHLRGNKLISDKLEELTPQGLAISIISLAELYEGVYNSKNPGKSQKLLNIFLNSDIEILGIYDSSICEVFGKEKGRLRKNGELIGDFDLLIASTALYYELTLLSNNRKHFERIKGLKIISL